MLPEPPRFLPVGLFEGHGLPGETQEPYNKIEEEIKAIKPELLKRVMPNFHQRLRKCYDLFGGHLEHML